MKRIFNLFKRKINDENKLQENTQNTKKENLIRPLLNYANSYIQHWQLRTAQYLNWKTKRFSRKKWIWITGIYVLLIGSANLYILLRTVIPDNGQYTPGVENKIYADSTSKYPVPIDMNNKILSIDDSLIIGSGLNLFPKNYSMDKLHLK